VVRGGGQGYASAFGLLAFAFIICRSCWVCSLQHQAASVTALTETLRMCPGTNLVAAERERGNQH